MSLFSEWNELFSSNDKIYIYGAGDIARLLVEQAKKSGYEEKIAALIVSENPDKYSKNFNIPVLSLGGVEDKNSLVLIGVSKKYYDEVLASAKNAGFKNITDGFMFVHLFDENSDSDIESLFERKDLSKMDREEFKTLLHKIYGSDQLFGGSTFYQSLSVLDIDGIRPSNLRVKTYNLDKLVEDKEVLDIGCNCGFLDMTVADKAKDITGLEYSKSLSDIANVTAKYLGLSNTHFEQGDFVQYQTSKKFDVICYFAVHGWINLSAKDGVAKIKDLLYKDRGGAVIFESQDLARENGDPLYDAYCLEFLKQGFEKEDGGTICDDGSTKRIWTVFRLK